MTVQTVGPMKVAVFIDETDMHTYGIGNDGIHPDLAKSLVKDAFLRSGVPFGQRMEIAAFTGKNGIMVFAEIVGDDTESEVFEDGGSKLYVFTALDDAVSATRNLKAPYPDAGLTYYENKYYLNVRACLLNESHIRIISEYGMEIEWNMLFFIHITEHGHTIARHQAFDMLYAIV